MTAHKYDGDLVIGRRGGLTGGSAIAGNYKILATPNQTQKHTHTQNTNKQKYRQSHMRIHIKHIKHAPMNVLGPLGFGAPLGHSLVK